MANGDAFEHAVTLARQTPSLDVGCHLVLVQGKSVARSLARFARDVAGTGARSAATEAAGL